ncbi:hypothetical protein [Pelagicoccus sp. SDUM812005]|uniref:hypothetical protein n=1 Tax=Pelagicoccus sp. SDUM812005 TaxID=3041257 RepID=UPI00280FA083|nr:hypothetical protein [Pelagicoccus sp. SDUM812005]MDQ8183837.1 hypothetical protein [Pelagicoccus sp. SDUM812005]
MPNPGIPGDSSTLLLGAHTPPAAEIEAVHAGLASYRSLSIRRVYGHWTRTGQQVKNDTDKKIKSGSKLTSLLRLSRYIHTSDAETYRPIADIVEDLNVIEAEAKETDEVLRKILKQLGI